MGEDVEDVPGVRVYDGQPVDLVVDQAGDGVEQALLGGDGHQRLGGLAELLWKKVTHTKKKVAKTCHLPNFSA